MSKQGADGTDGAPGARGQSVSVFVGTEISACQLTLSDSALLLHRDSQALLVHQGCWAHQAPLAPRE